MIATKAVRPSRSCGPPGSHRGPRPRARSYITVCEERRWRGAGGRDSLMARPALGKLQRVPYALKDSTTPPACGPPGARACWPIGCRPGRHARSAARAGGHLLGKLNMVEFAYVPEGLNPHTPRPPPWTPTCTAWRAGLVRLGVAVAAGGTGSARLRHRLARSAFRLRLRHHRAQADVRPREPGGVLPWRGRWVRRTMTRTAATAR